MPEPACPTGSAPGFIVDAKGVVLTNHHVVDGAKEVVVQLTDGRKFVSKDIKSDPKTDLALVLIDAKTPLPALDLGDSNAMQIGDRVLAVGAPFGLTGSVTAGIISAKGRSLHMNTSEDFLQTDAAINPGNSGGPLVNMDGQVIGINTAIKSSTGGSQGVGLAITSDMARNIMQQLLKNGVVRRGYLGVQVRTLEPEVAVRRPASRVRPAWSPLRSSMAPLRPRPASSPATSSQQWVARTSRTVGSCSNSCRPCRLANRSRSA